MVTAGPDATTTTQAPEGVDEPTVEGSDNNTRTLKGIKMFSDKINEI